MNRLLKQAFTLIELLVVIAIIGILSGLIVVAMNGTTQKATIAKTQVFSSSLRNSLMLNLVSEWKFDGTTADGSPAVANDVLDTWNGVNNASISVAPTVKRGTNCVSGSCLYFNGSSFLSIPQSDSLSSSDTTWIMWLKMPYQANCYVFSKRPAWDSNYALGIEMSQDVNQKLRIRFGYGTGYEIWNMNVGVYDDTWHMLAVTVSGTSVRTYLDGVYQNTKTATANLNQGTYQIILMRYQDTGGFTTGSIDDIRIYNAAMPNSQIKEQYYSGLNKLLTSGTITKEDYQSRMGELAVDL